MTGVPPGWHGIGDRKGRHAGDLDRRGGKGVPVGFFHPSGSRSYGAFPSFSHEKSWEKLRKTEILKGEKNLLEPLYLLSDRDPLHGGLSDHQYHAIQAERQSLNASHPGWEDQLVASRYDLIHQIVQRSVQRHEEEGVSLSDRLDQYLLHPTWGWAVLLGILGLLFTLIFKVADGPMGWIETFFEWAALQVASNMSEGDLRALITDGVIAGVGGVVVFLPQILILFFFIGFMEDTGYMARVAFMMDRLMSRVATRLINRSIMKATRAMYPVSSMKPMKKKRISI